MKKMRKSKTVLVADVDCTSDEGKPLCEANGIEGYPTLKYGDPDDLETYEGERTYKAMKKFAKKLKPSCSPSNIHLCDDEKKAEIEELQKLSDEELDAAVEEGTAELAAIKAKFDTDVKALQEKYQQLEADKKAGIKAIEDSGLKLKKAVKKARAKQAKEAVKEEL